MMRPMRIGMRAIDSPVTIGPRALRRATNTPIIIGPRASRRVMDSPVTIGPRALQRAMDSPVTIGSGALPSVMDSPVTIILRREYVLVDEVLIFRDFRSFPPTIIRQESAPVNESFYIQEARPNPQASRHPEYVRTNNSFTFGHYRPTTIGRDAGGGTVSTSQQVANFKEVRIEKEENECSICLEVMCFGHIAGQLLCTHVFHKDCIGRWLKDSTSCPLCCAPAVINTSTTSSINA